MTKIELQKENIALRKALKAALELLAEDNVVYLRERAA